MRLLLVGFVLLVIIIAAFYAYTVMGSEGFVFFGEPAPGKPKVPLWEVFASVAAMLLGLTAGVTSEHLGRPEAAGNVARSIKEAATSPAFFRALLASPLIYAGVYAVAQRQPDTVIALI